MMQNITLVCGKLDGMMRRSKSGSSLCQGTHCCDRSVCGSSHQKQQNVNGVAKNIRLLTKGLCLL